MERGRGEEGGEDRRRGGGRSVWEEGKGRKRHKKNIIQY